MTAADISAVRNSSHASLIKAVHHRQNASGRASRPAVCFSAVAIIYQNRAVKSCIAYSAKQKHMIARGGINMKAIIKIRSSFAAQSREQLRRNVTQKVEKLAGKRMKKAG